MPTQMVLNEIFVELLVGGGVLNVPECFKKCLDFIKIFLWLHTGTNIIEEEIQVQVLLILNNHVVKNHTSGHDVMEGTFVPKVTRTSNYCKSCLQNTESSLNIFPGCLLCLCKFGLGSVLGISDGLHKCCPLRIIAVRK
jgi:hypothetical protein